MEITLSFIKPNALKKGKAGAILQKYLDGGLSLSALKMKHLSKEFCEKFYEEHKSRPFFEDLVDFISSGPIVIIALKGPHAISLVREIMGDTDPQKAQPGTIRAEYGDSIGENAVHGSDSLESAKRELALMFSEEEIT